MNILLLNQNPVVEKLVTLSAHKLGATVVSVNSSKGLETGDYDLLIVDEGVYSFEIFGDLAESITYKKSLYLHARDSEPVDIFNYQIKKPFLPTDLVELLSQITQTIAQSEGKGADTFADHHDDETFKEIGDFTEDVMNPANDDNFDNNSFTDDNNFVEDNSFTDDDFASHLMDEEEHQQVLDQDDVQEVQKLLEDEDSSSPENTDEDHLMISDLDDVALDKADEMQEPPEADEDTKTLLKEELDEIIEHDFADDLHAPDGDNEVEELEQTTQTPKEDDQEQTTKIPDNTDDALSAISMQIEEKMNTLDDELLDAPVEEVLPLAPEDHEESHDMLDEFSSLDEDMLKAAIEEDDDDLQSNEEDIVPQPSSAEMERESMPQDDTKSGAQALTALLKTLQDEGVKASLKGMNIDIHISIGPAK